MNKYIQYVNEIQGGNEYWIYFIENQLKKYLKDNKEDQTEIEHILDFVYSNKKTYKSIWYKTILKKANAWTEKLIKNAPNINDEKDWAIEIIKEWDNWFKIVKLLTEEAFIREWKLMSHCLGGYETEWKDIYSLRDERNYPHCTIEKWNQIKWKWNNSIIPKYISYVVEFLEEIWMEMRNSEMKNIWYEDISFYKEIWILKGGLELFREKYIFTGFKKIEDMEIFNCEVHFCESVTEAKNKWLI